MFKGIPFTPRLPFAYLRWRDLKRLRTSSGNADRRSFLADVTAVAAPKNSVFYLGEEASSEDCLYIECLGASAGQPKKPVMVFHLWWWLDHRLASLPLYSGDGLARKGVVVALFNYRVGTLDGFQPSGAREGIA